MKNFARLQLLPTLLVVAATLSFVQCTKAASQVLWQIGKFDKSSLEFDQSVVPTPKPYTPHPVVYVIGKSQAPRWPRFQPGSSNGLAGFRPHPYAIQFDLPSTPHGVYTLKVALLVERPSRGSPGSGDQRPSRAVLPASRARLHWGRLCQRLPAQLLRRHDHGRAAHQIPAPGDQRVGVDGA